MENKQETGCVLIVGTRPMVDLRGIFVPGAA